MELYKIDPDILCPSYLFMANLFIDYIDAILNDVLIFDVIKSKTPEFVGHSKSGWNFNASVKSYQILMSHDFITPCELK